MSSYNEKHLINLGHLKAALQDVSSALSENLNWNQLNGKTIYVYGDSLSDESDQYETPVWTSGITYYKNDRVRKDSTTYYMAKSTHTSSASNQPPNSTYWEEASYTTRGLQPNWVAKMRMYLPDATIINHSRAGYPITALDTAYIEASIYGLIKNHPPVGADYVIIWGGINDFNYSRKLGEAGPPRYPGESTAVLQTFGGCLSLISDILFTQAPDARVFVITLPKYYLSTDLHSWPASHDVTKPSLLYSLCLANWATKNGYNLIDGYGFPRYVPAVSSSRRSFTSDGIHMWPAYADILTPYILNKLVSEGDSALYPNATRVSIESLAASDVDFTISSTSTGWAYAMWTSTGRISYAFYAKLPVTENTNRDVIIFNNSSDHLAPLFSGVNVGYLQIGIGTNATYETCRIYYTASKIVLQQPSRTGTGYLSFMLTADWKYNGRNLENDNQGTY